MTTRLVILISGNGTNLQAVIDACQSGELKAQIIAVISNKAEAFGVQRAQKAGITTLVKIKSPQQDRRDYDRELADMVAHYKPDWIVLAGWMRILSANFIDRFPKKIINLHPALPGKFPGVNAIERAWELFRKGEIDHTGVMVHLVDDEDVDCGSLLAETTVPIKKEDTLEQLTERVHEAEHVLLIATLKKLFMKILCIIPSRIGSTRLPRKPLLPIQGKPMVQWVYENASRCTVISQVIVATDSEEIAQVIQACGGKTVMTDPHLKTGSDRVAVVAEQFPEFEVVINLQGDEPFIKPKMLEQLVAPYLAGKKPDMTTLAYPLITEQEYQSPDIVKVITDKNKNALYFSRAPIPYFRNVEMKNHVPVYHHIGLYAFRRDFLLRYKDLSQTPLEKAELLEQLRALEHGHQIHVCLTEERSLEINTPEELTLAQNF